jgi:hypothetical protein
MDVKIGMILQSKGEVKCFTGYIVKDDPVQVIRVREDNTIDVVNLRNQLIFKCPVQFFKSI